VTLEPAPHLGLLLYRARLRAGVGLRSAARTAGCSHTLLSLIESGKRRLQLRGGNLDFYALCRRLGIQDAEQAALVQAASRQRFFSRGGKA
jgi:transcriptional regulator with XRE-family HTH domain